MAESSKICHPPLRFRFLLQPLPPIFQSSAVFLRLREPRSLMSLLELPFPLIPLLGFPSQMDPRVFHLYMPPLPPVFVRVLSVVLSDPFSCLASRTAVILS
ncbi:hypothetical protein DFH09DRAFT_1076250 [Mycena vulgaris]|nr:hypothetical protein DFH09DRAFT_1076250 [Mycena vulgaris]